MNDSPVKLYQLPCAYDLPISVSPFCAKVEAYFRLASIAYETKPGDPRKGPTKKVPYIKYEREIVGDSSLILEWCKKKFGDPLDKTLTKQKHYLGHLVKRLCEEHLYWPLLYSRFTDENGWAHQKKVVSNMIPGPMGPIVCRLIRKSIVQAIYHQGIARHTKENVYESGIKDLRVLESLLGDTPFLLGHDPTTYDCSIYAILVHVLATPSENALSLAAKNMESLTRFVETMNRRLNFPEKKLQAS